MAESIDLNGFDAPGDAGGRAKPLAEKPENRTKLKSAVDRMSDDEVERLLEILESEEIS